MVFKKRKYLMINEKCEIQILPSINKVLFTTYVTTLKCYICGCFYTILAEVAPSHLLCHPCVNAPPITATPVELNSMVTVTCIAIAHFFIITSVYLTCQN